MTYKFTSEDVYTQQVGDLYDEADKTNNPISRDLLLDLVADNGVNENSLVLDIGCANGGLSRQLLAKTNCTIEGVELLPLLVDMGNKENQELRVAGKFKIQQGGMSNIPFEDNHFDFVFCSDVIGLVEDLDVAFKECARVLKPDGKMLVYATSFKTDRMSESEAEFLGKTLGGDRGTLLTVSETEAAISKHFKINEKRIIGSQFGQKAIEKQGADSEAVKNLLKIARLQTWPEKYIEKYGEKTYQIVLGEVMWSPFILLGKLEPTVFVVQRHSN